MMIKSRAQQNPAARNISQSVLIQFSFCVRHVLILTAQQPFHQMRNWVFIPGSRSFFTGIPIECTE
jgi:hypothetical protein